MLSKLSDDIYREIYSYIFIECIEDINKLHSYYNDTNDKYELEVGERYYYYDKYIYVETILKFDSILQLYFYLRENYEKI